MISVSEINNFFKGKIALNENLSRYTTFRIGGEADIYLEPSDERDLINIIRYSKENAVPYYILGNGSNILISDEGVRGMVINLESGFNYLKLDYNGKIISGAGVKMAKFVDFCIQNEYSGTENLAGIPGTLGGALIMNAGAYGGEIGSYVSKVSVIRNSQVKHLSQEECGFRYRNSALRDTIIYEATFTFPKGNKEELSARRKELLLKRNEAQPVEIPNAGCIFKNPEGNYAAKLIQDAGLKGKRVGGAMVSPKHANFIVNFDKATAEDIITLIKDVRKNVMEKFGIKLDLEVKLVGFGEEVI